MNSKSEYLGQRIKRTNLDRKKDVFNCNTCGYEMSTQEQIDQHTKKFHDRINCKTCAYIAFGERDLQEHMKNKQCSPTI